MLSHFKAPDIKRYALIEAGKNRLITGCLTVQIVSYLVYLATMQDPEDPGLSLIMGILALQWIVLLIYGSVRMIGSIVTERSELTWDFQRLTPLTSWEITWGKLIGAPIYAYFLFAMFLPWTFYGIFISPSVGFLDLAVIYMKTACFAICVLSIGLFISANSEKARSGLSITAGVLIGFFSLQTMYFLVSVDPKYFDKVTYYGLSLTTDKLAFITVLVYGLWAFLGARWRIGEDLLEAGTFWRFPAFLVFVFFYILGFIPLDAKWYTEALYLLFLPPIFILYGASVQYRFRQDHLRKWLLSKTMPEIMNRSPVWLRGLLILIPLAILSWVISSERSENTVRLLILLFSFTVRDLAFLQWCRLGNTKRPDTMWAVFVLILYIMPNIVLLSFQMTSGYSYFVPQLENQESFLTNTLPSLLQASIMCYFLWRRVRGVNFIISPSSTPI